MKTGSAIRLLACGALLALGVSFASAQMRAIIPFDFSASGSNLVAGAYTVETTGDTNQVLQMCNLQKHRCVFMIASQIASRPQNDPGKLVFNRYGDQYLLSEVWSRSLVRTLPQDQRERQLAKSGAEPVVAVIAAELSSHTGR